ncbi:MAG: peptidyl-prolyl cis-trans isomerase [Mycobacterium sp.]|nr:peptidyl-prolyl cis-trans isomerase [Mycobacterium sp.]
MSDGGYGGAPKGPYDGDLFGAIPYPQPPIISAPAPAPRRKTNIFATLSVVFAFVFAPVGAVFGHLGLSQIRRTKERGRERALIGLTLSYVFVLIAVAALGIWTVVGMRAGKSSTVAASPPAATSSVPEQPFVTAAQLPKLLLSIDEVKQAVNAPNLAKVDDATGLASSQGLTVTPPECLSSVFAGAAPAYEHSSFRGTFSRTITGDGNGGMILLDETVSTFENIADATRLVSRLVGQWRGCAGKSVTLVANSNPITLDVGQPVPNGTVMMLSNSLRGGMAEFSSDRAIVAKANVVIDLDAQGYDMGDALMTLAGHILARVPS